MARQHAASVLAAALLVGVFASIPSEVQSIGVCYGVKGAVLPSASQVVQLYVSRGITGMRIYFPDSNALQSLSGTKIGLIMDVGDQHQVASLAASTSNAAAWVKLHVVPYPGVNIRYIAVGNEVTGDATRSILPAMKNLKDALSAAGLDKIKVSMAVKMDVLLTSSPPSSGAFRDAYMAPIVQFLANTGAPLLANVYPYFAFRDNKKIIDLRYSLFQPSTTKVSDNGLTYTNLFDAMVDALHAAMTKAGAPGVRIVVSETGWPSAGAPDATVSNAQAYNQGLINHVGKGTPRMPQPLETYIFAMFNENKKQGEETEKHFGLFNPDTKPAYTISF